MPTIGRFVEGKVTGGHTPRAEISKDGKPPSHDPPLAVRLLLGDGGEAQMTVAQWLEFDSSVGDALRQEGLIR